MLIVNSRIGQLTIFPALLDEWTQGELKGVLAREQVNIEQIKWDESNIHLKLTSEVR